MPSWIPVVFGTIVCWGSYGILLHQGRLHLGNSYRAFLWVGIAYAVIALMVPLLFMSAQTNIGATTTRGNVFAFAAGTAGALGALGTIIAFGLGGHPLVVMPLIYAGAPLVNTIIVSVVHPSKEQPSPLFFAGIILASIGTWLFVSNAPHG
jgi:hypothetical protein